eukprot:m51a1_g11389 hypothetical protein (270) ;mRNA; r:15863-19480
MAAMGLGTEAIRAACMGAARVAFITNNATRTRADLAKKFVKVGLPQPEEREIRTSARAAVGVVKQAFDAVVASGKPRPVAYVVGEKGLIEELRAAGIEAFGTEHNGLAFDPQSGEVPPQIDPRVGAVVVGFDGFLSFYKLTYATRCVRENAGCLFVAANTDQLTPTNGGALIPAAGAGVAALQFAIGREPVVCGKPETTMFAQLREEFAEIDPARSVMVGDNLDTDIAFGKRCGMKALLVLSGMSTADDVKSAKYQPDFIADSLGAIFA